MNSPTSETPTAPPPQTGDPLHLVAVKISIPVPLIDLTPNGNVIGTLTLSGLFNSELRRKNLFIEDAIFAGELNDSYFLLRVASVSPALAVLNDILNKLSLRESSSILFFYAKHFRFQPHGHDGAEIGIGFSLEEIKRLIKEAGEKWARVYAAALYLKGVYEKRRAANSDPDSEPPPPPAQPAP